MCISDGQRALHAVSLIVCCGSKSLTFVVGCSPFGRAMEICWQHFKIQFSWYPLVSPHFPVTSGLTCHHFLQEMLRGRGRGGGGGGGGKGSTSHAGFEGSFYGDSGFLRMDNWVPLSNNSSHFWGSQESKPSITLW